MASEQQRPRPVLQHSVSEATEKLLDYDGVDDYFDTFSDDPEEHTTEPVDLEEMQCVAATQAYIYEHEHKDHSHKFSFIKWPKKVLHIHHAHHHDRKLILREAAEYGKTLEACRTHRHLTIIYNPVSGAGIAKKLVDHMVLPVLQLSGCKYTVVATQYRGHAIEIMLGLDPATTDGVLICGGDGLVHEVVTGFMRRPDCDSVDLPLGLVPSGTANAMAHELHAHSSKSHVALVGRAALAAARGHVRRVDVLSCAFSEKQEDTIYALSVFGWGLAGTVAKAADNMRWLPGQKRFRYDIAGFVSMMKDWPTVCRGVISYPVGENKDWKEEKLDCINFTATNLPWLGLDHPMTRDVAPDDGYLVVSWVPSTVSRLGVMEMGMGMKSGHFLMEHKNAVTIKVPEFKIQVEPNSRFDMNIDGDPAPPADVHVRALHQKLRVFADPKTVVGPLMVKISKSSMRDGHVPFSPEAPADPIPEEPLSRSGSMLSLPAQLEKPAPGSNISNPPPASDPGVHITETMPSSTEVPTSTLAKTPKFWTATF